MSKLTIDDLIAATLGPNIFDPNSHARRLNITTHPVPISWGAACHFVEEKKRSVFFVDGDSVKEVSTLDELIALHGQVNNFFTHRPIIKVPLEKKIYRAIRPFTQEGLHNEEILRKIREVLIENGVSVE